MPDHERPLNARGLKTAPLMGHLAADRGFHFDAILCSPAKRAMQTAEIFAREARFTDKIEIIPSFYPGEPNDHIHHLSRQTNDLSGILIVGHNPGMQLLLKALTGKNETMPTATLAHIGLPIQRWNDLSLNSKAELIDIYRPKEIFKELNQ